MLKRIHVNQHVIRSNKKLSEHEPPLTVKTYRENRRCHEVEILGPSRLVYSPEKPMACGARVWIETSSDVVTRREGSPPSEAKV